jgi:hypothetical protein
VRTVRAAYLDRILILGRHHLVHDACASALGVWLAIVEATDYCALLRLLRVAQLTAVDVVALDTNSRTQNGHIRNDTRDVSRRMSDA